MRIFSLREDDNRRNSGCIIGDHQWSLPGVSCFFCKSSWGGAGLEYPSVDLSGLSDERLFRVSRNEPLAVYLGLRSRIAEKFPQITLLQPGTLFGPISGRVQGKANGFIWQTPWTVCLDRGALDTLRARDLSLPIEVKVDLKAEKYDIRELDLPLSGKLANPVYDGIELDYCSMCGRDSGTLPDEILIDKASISDDYDIFRVRNFPTRVLVTERFVDAIKSLDIRGATFEEEKIV